MGRTTGEHGVLGDCYLSDCAEAGYLDSFLNQILLYILASRKKQTLLWEGQHFFVQQDLAVEVSIQRAAYEDITDKVKTTSLRFGLLYPPKFVVSIEGKTFKYKSPEATLLDIKDKLPDVF